WDEEANRAMTAKSTGKAKKHEAYAYCMNLLRKGKLLDNKTEKIPTLEEFCKKYNVFVWQEGKRPLCPRTSELYDASSEEAPAIQRNTVLKQKQCLDKHILPYHGKKLVSRIKLSDLKNLRQKLLDNGLTASYVNLVMTIYRIVFSIIIDKDIVSENPFKNLKAIRVDEKKRGILTQEEYIELMRPDNIEKYWNGDKVNYLINLIASITGLRVGEIKALKGNCIYPDHITIAHSYNDKTGLGLQKTKRGVDEIPIPKRLYEMIIQLVKAPDKYVFTLKGKKPPTTYSINTHFYDALEKIGIDKNKREERNIVFHSWRVFANTYFIGKGIARDKVQEITRHTSDIMTEHYTSFNAEDFKEVAGAQESLIAKLD
nr:tyrosine-type recombinase/integrase [Treponema sp.]